jgi:hypothetical protein
MQLLRLVSPARGTKQHDRTYNCRHDAKDRSDRLYHMGSSANGTPDRVRQHRVAAQS